ncbi:MAG: OPT/YSL family transporter [Polyangiaceae bacterium]|nr:OPT/YSL family transporter [Polyangiaceae bacterium]
MGEGRSIVRSIVTGMLVGSALSICNIYAGLKIGWSTTMGVTSALLSFAIWRMRSASAVATSPFTILETNLAQTAASSAAAVSSAGLVAAIPALTIMTGQVLPWYQLAAWTASVCFVGNVIAIPLRKQMLETDPLPFPIGVATAETLRQIYAKGGEAMARVRTLGVAALVSGGVKVLEGMKLVGPVGFPGALGKYPLKNLTFAFDPGVLLAGIGGLMGTRAALSVLGGSIFAYGVLGPELLDRGIVQAGPPDKPWFKPLVEWLLWPGVTMMVTASLTTLAFSWKALVRGIRGLASIQADDGSASSTTPANEQIPRSWLTRSAVLALTVGVALQISIFGIPWWAAVVGVLLSVVLGVVAARVSGETGLTPVGAMGKITQLTIGAALPGNVAANLMTANITGGAASQCADMMNDLKTGQELGASPKSQWISQVAGATAGALIGSAVYLIMIPDPAKQLLTPEWPAPAVITWKTVAEVFRVGVSALPRGTPLAVAIAAAVGIALAILEQRVDVATKKWLPSPSALGLAFTVSAHQCVSMAIGAVASLVVLRLAPAWHGRFWVVLCAGAIAGEGLVGAGLSIVQLLRAG